MLGDRKVTVPPSAKTAEPRSRGGEEGRVRGSSSQAASSGQNLIFTRAEQERISSENGQ